MKENVLKKYQLSNMKKMLLWLENYEFGESICDSISWAKFYIIDRFADNLVEMHDKDRSQDQEFDYTLIMDPVVEESMKKYLLKQKDFVLGYISSDRKFPNSSLYQLYLQYLPYDLTEVEKSILLDGYVHSLADKKGQHYAFQKRMKLEESLHIY